MFWQKELKKHLLAVLIVIFFLFPAKQSSASLPQAWPDFVGHAFGVMLEEMKDNVKGIILGALKQTAAELINSNVSSLISGSGSLDDAGFIQDWDDELFYKPARKAESMVESFFRAKYKGRSSDYLATNQPGSGVNKNYYTYLTELSQKAAREASGLASTQNLEEALLQGSADDAKLYDYCKDPYELFANENFMCWTALAGKPLETFLEAEEIQLTIMSQEMAKAEAQAIAYQGFKARTAGEDKVISPGSILKDIQSQSLDLGNKILASANHIPEVVSSLIVKISTQAIKQGIGYAQRNIQREVINPTKRAISDLSREIRNVPERVFEPKY